MVLFTLFLRAILVYLIVFLTTRLTGKREIGRLSVLELVISIMIAEMAVLMLGDVDRPLIEWVTPMATLVAVQLLITYISRKSEKLRRLFEGRLPLMNHGKMSREEIRRQRHILDDLLLQLRQSKFTSAADVEFAMMEPSGKLTVIEKTAEEAVPGSSPSAQGSPAQATIRYEGLPLPLIMDGRVQEESLQKLGKTRFWLKGELHARGIKAFKEVFFCSIDHRGKWFIDRKR